MSKPAGNNQDLDSVGILLLVVTAGMVVLYLLMLLVPIFLLAFLLAELFLFLLFKEHQYVLTNSLKILAVSVSAFLLILSLPSNAVVEKFQGFGFMFFNEQIAWLIASFLNFFKSAFAKENGDKFHQRNPSPYLPLAQLACGRHHILVEN